MGEIINYLRKREKMTQEKLAELLGVSRQAVSKWERGQAIPNGRNIIQMSRIFHITVEELWKY